MTLKLYGTLISPPVRAVLLCAKAIDVKLDWVEVDLMKGEHLKPEFVKLNPLHTVPVLDDNGFVLVDSHAIMGYLVDNYAKNKSFYPADVKRRARINQLLHFDSGTLFARHLQIAAPVLLGGEKTIAEEKIKSVNEAYGFLESFLENNKYVAGDTLSIADFSIITTISNASVFVPLDENQYPKIKSWKNSLEAIPYYNINKEGYEAFHSLVKSVLPN